MLIKKNRYRFGLNAVLQIALLYSMIYLLPRTIYADGYASTTQSSQDSLSKYIDLVRKTIIGRFGLRFEIDRNGIPTSITGDLSKNTTASDPVEQAYQFFDLNRDIFPIKDAKTEFNVRQQIGGDESFGPTVKLAWCVNGIMVGGTEIILNYSRDGKLYSYYGEFYPEARMINTNPAISEERAKSIVITDMEKVKIDWPENAKAEIKNATLMIARFNGELKLAWGIGVMKGYEGYGYWIDAQTGKIIESASSKI
jgi:Zn-dependent metalloprotease